MKLIVTLVVFALFGLHISAQEINRIERDDNTDSSVLVGKSTREGLSADPFRAWFNSGYDNYNPDQKTISELRKRRSGISIIAVIGTWCGDTKEHLPNFFKILDAMRFNDRNLELIALDTARESGGMDISALAIDRVPTFILFKNETEIGRIVEMPTISLEKDMLLMLMQTD